MKQSKVLLGLGALAVAGAVLIPWTLGAAPAQNGQPAAQSAPGNAAGASTHKKTEQMRGFSMQLNDSSDHATESYVRAIDELANMGCTWINLAVAARQYDIHSASVALNMEKVPSILNILKIIQKAKSRNMGVMLMPMVLLISTGTKDWRGIIDPKKDGKADGKSDWDNWFATYRAFICNMADVAQRSDVDIFVVGSELLSTEEFRDQWVETINEIKNGRKDRDGTLMTHGYKGKLTYSANWDHYEHVKFWDQLDYVGMNNYNDLSDGVKDMQVADINKKWVKIKDDILKFSAEQKKPFMFTEVGWHNRQNTLKEPWNYVSGDPIDRGPQTRAFQSFVETWQTVPRDQFMGAFIWEWCPEGHYDDPGTYSLQGTDALKIVQKWFIAP